MTSGIARSAFLRLRVMQPLIMRGPTTIRGTARVDLSRWETYGDPVPTRTGGLFLSCDSATVTALESLSDTLTHWIGSTTRSSTSGGSRRFRRSVSGQSRTFPRTRKIDADGNVRITPIADDEYDDMFTASPDEMWQVPGDVGVLGVERHRHDPITAAIERMCDVWLRSRRSRCRRWCPIARTGPLRAPDA